MKKKVIGIIIILLLIVVAIIGALYLTTDLFKTPEQLFYKHFANNLLGKMSYEEIMTEVQSSKMLSMETEGEITGKITTSDESMEELGKALEKAKITYNKKVIASEQKLQNDIKLSYNDKNIVTLNLLQNKEQYGIKIDELHHQYISIENNNLKSVFEKLGMDTTDIPEKFTQVDYYELLNIDEEALNYIKATYYSVLKENIEQEAYSVENNVTVKIDENDVITNAYKLTLTEEQINTIVVKLLEVLKADDKTLDVIIEKNDMLKDSIISTDEEELTKEKLIEKIEDAISEIKNNETTENETLTIVVYGEIDGKSKIEIIEKVEDKETSKTELNMIRAEDGIKKLIVSGVEEDITAEIVVSYDGTKTDLSIKTGDGESVVEINIREEIKATDNITVEEFDSNNSVKLNDMTESEIEQLVGKIYLNVLYVLPQKVQLLGIDLSEFNNTEEDTVENSMIENDVVESAI